VAYCPPLRPWRINPVLVPPARPAGRIVFANQAARSRLALRDGLQIDFGMLAAGRRDRNGALRHMI
jgi:hypothetical protein